MVDNKPTKSADKERMAPEHLFRFQCRPGISCFTQCCKDVTIVLTPYDVLRLKNSLKVTSDEFLDTYTIILPKSERLIPLVVLKMNEDNKKCPFVSEKGCQVYENRPWPCRMYPLDMGDDGSFHLIAREENCKGLLESAEQQISSWLEEQDIGTFDEINELFSDVTRPLMAQKLDIDNPSIMKMIFMALYNLDKFREFVFNSTFLDRFEVEPERIKRIKEDELALLKFAFDWTKFGLFGEKLFWVKENPEK